MKTYFFEGLVADGQSAAVLTQDGRYGTIDLVHFTVTAADLDDDNPSEARLERAARLADPPTRNQFYFPFGRELAQSTARIGEKISLVGSPQSMVMLTSANRDRATATMKKMLALMDWWRDPDSSKRPAPGVLHISQGLDTRFTAGQLTFASYQAQWREITAVKGKVPREVGHYLREQKQLWGDFIKQMRADPNNQAYYLIILDPGADMQVLKAIPGNDFLVDDPELYSNPEKRHEQFKRWLTLGQ